MTDRPMEQYRGAVILCDHLDQMQGGKWAIIGTYTNLLVPQATHHHFAQGLSLYLRFQAERTGRHEVELRLIARDAPPTTEPILRTRFAVDVSDVHSPVELGTRMPPFTVHCPAGSLQPGQQLPVRFVVWAEVGGCTLATTPLTVVFSGPEPERADG